MTFEEKLAAAGILQVEEIRLARHAVFARGSAAALVERQGDGFGSVGNPCYMSEAGIETLLWKEERPYLVRQGSEREATPGQVEEMRALVRDLEIALRGRGEA